MKFTIKSGQRSFKGKITCEDNVLAVHLDGYGLEGQVLRLDADENGPVLAVYDSAINGDGPAEVFNLKAEPEE